MADTEKNWKGFELKGFDKYSYVLLDIVRKVLWVRIEEDKGVALASIDNLFFNEKTPLKKGKELSKGDNYLFKTFKGYLEISYSYESLLDFELYVRRFPFSGTRTTKARYLSHIIEAYFNEMYIFKKRLIKFLVELKKAYRSDSRRLEIEKIVKALCGFVSKCLKPIVLTRGSHVHQSRYTDRDIDKLSQLELLASSDFIFADLYESEYKKTREKWKNTISKNNKVIEEILDEYFGELFDVFFSKKGKLIYPENM